MNSADLIADYKEYVLGTYAPSLMFVKGQGSQLWDADGRQYLDFGTGIAVCNLGHCHPAVTEAIQRQAATLVHVSNLYMNNRVGELAKWLSTKSFGGRVFFCNSGAEANEGLIKLARKWGRDQGRHEIVCMTHSFHGRTIATLAATDKPAIRDPFAPELPGFRFVAYNDLDALAAAITPQTAAVLMEPVQGEGGLTPSTQAFISGARELCDAHGILLLFDEVQCGMGRTGEWFAYQTYGVTPDAMSLAKGIANGFPMGAFIVDRKHEGVLGVSSHATTFGGTALACAAAIAVCEVIEREDILFNVRKMGEHLKGGLVQIARHRTDIVDVRGRGLMVGVEFDRPVADIVAGCTARGLIILTAGTHVLRLLPALNVTPQDVDRALATLKTVIEETSA